jgi:hypothetical protein
MLTVILLLHRSFGGEIRNLSRPFGLRCTPWMTCRRLECREGAALSYKEEVRKGLFNMAL